VSAWWVGKVLPSVVSSGIWWLALWVSHRKLRRHIDTVTARQNEHIDQLTADQTRELRSSAGVKKETR
jgi:hypothetical protein